MGQHRIVGLGLIEMGDVQVEEETHGIGRLAGGLSLDGNKRRGSGLSIFRWVDSNK